MTAKVLIVDDSTANRLVLIDALEDDGYELLEAADGLEALEAARQDPPDLILLDVMMPRLNGLECCRRLKADAGTSDVPIILVTALNQDEHVIEGLNAGATDYVTKPFAGAVIRARARAALRSKLARDELRERNREIQRLARALAEKNRQLAHIALHDGLTGLPNRILFMDRLEQAILRRGRDADDRFALLFLDLDCFKAVNDSLGHEAGDALLVRVAEVIRKELRAADTVSAPGAGSIPSRLGGDEFVILLEGIGAVEAVEGVAERLQSALAHACDGDARATRPTASIGIVISNGEYATADEMLRDADTAMYLAKDAGRARHVVLDPERRAAVRATSAGVGLQRRRGGSTPCQPC